MINSDPQTAWTMANNLCFRHQPIPAEEVDDIVFFTDASARRLTESRFNRDRGVLQWLKMLENPVEWRFGVAITWDIPPSSALYNSSKQAAPKTKSTGAWHSETDDVKPIQDVEWKAPNEAAYQISGVQHYNQAELMGILFALERAVTIYRTHYHNISKSIDNGDYRPATRKLTNSITILTDSKPAMWDLTGENWHTDSIRTGSDYWILRQENTKRIVLQAKKYMKILRSMKVAVTIQWVPGHCGVFGNEWVDGLSRFARLLPPRFGNGSSSMEEEGNGNERACEEDGWEDMGLMWVEKAMVVDTGLGLNYDPHAVD